MNITEAIYKDEMSPFFNSLHTDYTVQKLGAENHIRDLTEKIIRYVDHANHANYAFQSAQKMKIKNGLGTISEDLKNVDNEKITAALSRLVDALDESQTQKLKPILPTLADIKNIAYLVETSENDGGLFQKMLSVDPLDAKVQDLIKHYGSFEKTGLFLYNNFDRDIQRDIAIAIDRTAPMAERNDSLNNIFEKGAEHMNRKVRLLRSADLGESILYIYFKEACGTTRQFKNEDISWKSAVWEDEKLSKKEIKTISGYLSKQAEINGIQFETLGLLGFRLRGREEPEKVIKKMHQDFMADYKSNGFLNIVSN